MTDFLLAALPWVLIGIAVAVIAASFGSKKIRYKRAGKFG